MTIIICVLVFIVFVGDCILTQRRSNRLCDELTSISNELYLLRRSQQNHYDEIAKSKLELESFAEPLNMWYDETLPRNEHIFSAD